MNKNIEAEKNRGGRMGNMTNGVDRRITRRVFIKGAGIGVAASILAGCAPKELLSSGGDFSVYDKSTVDKMPVGGEKTVATNNLKFVSNRCGEIGTTNSTVVPDSQRVIVGTREGKSFMYGACQVKEDSKIVWKLVVTLDENGSQEDMNTIIDLVTTESGDTVYGYKDKTGKTIVMGREFNDGTSRYYSPSQQLEVDLPSEKVKEKLRFFGDVLVVKAEPLPTNTPTSEPTATNEPEPTATEETQVASENDEVIKNIEWFKSMTPEQIDAYVVSQGGVFSYDKDGTVSNVPLDENGEPTGLLGGRLGYLFTSYVPEGQPRPYVYNGLLLGFSDTVLKESVMKVAYLGIQDKDGNPIVLPAFIGYRGDKVNLSYVLYEGDRDISYTNASEKNPVLFDAYYESVYKDNVRKIIVFQTSTLEGTDYVGTSGSRADMFRCVFADDFAREMMTGVYDPNHVVSPEVLDANGIVKPALSDGEAGRIQGIGKVITAKN